MSLWNLLCDEKKKNLTPLEYEINYYKIKFKFYNQKTLIFSNLNNNRIENFNKEEIQDFPLYKSNFDDISKHMYKSINDYYEYEKNFLNNINIFTYIKDSGNGYLVDLNWFNEWKKFYDYSNIKSKYLEQNSTQKEIIDYIIYFQHLNKIKRNRLSETKINKLSSKYELESFLKKNKVVLVNTSLIALTSKDFSDRIIYYEICNKKIEFNINYQESLIVDIKDNIISIQTENSFKLPNLKQLIKIFFFRKYLREEIIKEHEIKNENNFIILIKKDIIEQYLSYFNYKTLSYYLENINIDYNNYEQKYDALIKYLEQKISDYFKEMKNKENLNHAFYFNEEKYNLLPNEYIYKGTKLNYISDFEIIDNNIYSYFKENNLIKEDQVIKGEYIAEEKKILLCYTYKGKDYYEIVTFDSNYNFIIKYIIDGILSTKKIIMEKFNLIGINQLLNNLDQKNSKISYGNHSICYCYEYKKDEGARKIDIITKDNNQYNIFKIFLLLISLNIFEEDMKKKLKLSESYINDLEDVNSNPFVTKSYKLINGNLIDKMKKLFDYKIIKSIVKMYQLNSETKQRTIEQIFKVSEKYQNFLLEKKKYFLEFTKNASDFFKIETIKYEKELYNFNYPVKFNIIKQDLYDLLLNIFDLNQFQQQTNYSNKTEEILLTYNKGFITFKGLKQNFCDNNKPLLYIYSFNEEHENDAINYNPEGIIDFRYPLNLNNNLKLIMKENIIDRLRNSQKALESEFGCKAHLIYCQ